MFAHDLWILSHRVRRLRQPILGLLRMVRFKRRIHGTGNNQGIGRRPLEGLLVTLLRFRKLARRAIQITHGQIGHIVVGMFLLQFQEVVTGGRIVAHLARHEAQRPQCAGIRWIDGQRLTVRLPRFLLSIHLPKADSRS